MGNTLDMVEDNGLDSPSQEDPHPITAPTGFNKILATVWVYGAIGLGSLGFVLGVVSLFIPGRVTFVWLNRRPVETVGDKAQVIVFSLVFVVAGNVILFLQRSRRAKEAAQQRVESQK
jgi:hypothetical protein